MIFTDTDGDGDADIYVANDSVMNLFFRNLGDGRFEEVALAAGLGFSEEGRAEAGMGVDAGDDGKLGLFVTNYEFETNTLYRNLDDGAFVDATYRTGLAVPSLPWVGFGTSFFRSSRSSAGERASSRSSASRASFASRDDDRRRAITARGRAA